MTKLLTFSAIPHLSFSRQSVAAWLLLGAACSLAPLSASAAVVGQLRCEYLKDPLGIDTLQPRLSWVLDADKTRRPRPGPERLPDPGRQQPERAGCQPGRLVGQRQGQLRPIHPGALRGQGVGLRAGMLLEGAGVGQQGKPSAWSEPARWTMGLLNPSDWHAKWIGLDEPAAGRPRRRCWATRSGSGSRRASRKRPRRSARVISGRRSPCPRTAP
jgi:alpha-L-rhamnosidase